MHKHNRQFWRVQYQKPHFELPNLLLGPEGSLDPFHYLYQKLHSPKNICTLKY